MGDEDRKVSVRIAVDLRSKSIFSAGTELVRRIDQLAPLVDAGRPTSLIDESSTSTALPMAVGSSRDAKFYTQSILSHALPVNEKVKIPGRKAMSQC